MCLSAQRSRCNRWGRRSAGASPIPKVALGIWECDLIATTKGSKLAFSAGKKEDGKPGAVEHDAEIYRAAQSSSIGEPLPCQVDGAKQGLFCWGLLGPAVARGEPS